MIVLALLFASISVKGQDILSVEAYVGPTIPHGALGQIEEMGTIVGIGATLYPSSSFGIRGDFSVERFDDGHGFSDNGLTAPGADVYRLRGMAVLPLALGTFLVDTRPGDSHGSRFQSSFAVGVGMTKLNIGVAVPIESLPDSLQPFGNTFKLQNSYLSLHAVQEAGYRFRESFEGFVRVGLDWGFSKSRDYRILELLSSDVEPMSNVISVPFIVGGRFRF
ncbi:MAG: hypothetical protein ACREMD_08265 [Gemmatimonadota bacterium]